MSFKMVQKHHSQHQRKKEATRHCLAHIDYSMCVSLYVWRIVCGYRFTRKMTPAAAAAAGAVATTG